MSAILSPSIALVARLIAGIYRELGILSKGNLVETDRSGLVAGYVGQTAIKVREVVDKAKGDESEKKNKVNNGILFCSGMIAGEGLVGILLAILAIVGVNKALVISDNLNLPAAVSNAGTIVVLLIAIFAILKSSVWKKSKKD